MGKSNLQQQIELLEIQLRHLENDYFLTKEEYELSSEKYLEILFELKKRNTELQNLKDNLEKIVEEQTKELKESEKILIAKSNELQIMLDSSPALIFYKDKKGKYIRINKAFADFLGKPIKSLVGKKESYFFPDVARKHKNEDKAILKTGIAKLNIIESVLVNDEKRWIEIDKIPYSDIDGKVIGIIGFARDITENKKAESERQKLEEQLIQSQKMDSIGKLAGGVAHDFNNLLTGILGFAEFLKLKFDDPESKEFKAIDHIVKLSLRASSLTEKLLGFARQGKFNQVPLNLNTVIDEVVKVSEIIFEKKIIVKFEFASDIYTIEADKNQFAQVITNIIINAKHAMPKGGKLTIRTENVLVDKDFAKDKFDIEPGNYAMMSITDNGCGMTREIIDQIFEPFFTTKSEGQGTGLGLSMVYGIIKNHNGHIDVKSIPGKGSTFSIFLPESTKKILTEITKTHIIKGDETILVVDDEDNVRELLKTHLEYLGYNVILARDGLEAVKIYKKNVNNIDMVLLDIIMPKMDGLEALRKLKKINPEVRVLIMSGFSQSGKTSDTLNKDTLGFLQKPFTLQKLSEMVNETLKFGCEDED